MQMITQSQQDYLESLFFDLGFTRTERSVWLTLRGASSIYLDELGKFEASKFISELEEQKER